MTPRPPDSTGNLSSAETNPLPHVSSARAWTAVGETQTKAPALPRPSRPLITLPKATPPVIREKVTAPRRLRADGTEEICADDILVIVPRAPSSESIDESDILVEVSAPEPFRTPSVSVHATQEILADDVLEVHHVANIRKETPSSVPPPWTVDVSADGGTSHAASDTDLEFPNPPQYSGQYPAVSTGPRLTNFSATQVFRRRSANVKIVIASLSAAAAVVTIAGLARFAPAAASSSDGPIGIAMHAPKKLDKSVRARTLAYGTAPRVQEAVTISIDSLPQTPHVRYRHR